jgi:hypothetical protein
MVHVSNRPHVHVRLRSLKLPLRHGCYLYKLEKTGAHERDRTADLVLTKDVLYQLSYVGRIHMERVMGIEPT